MQASQTIYEGFPSTYAPCWPPPPGSNRPAFERNLPSLQGHETNHYPPVNQLNAYASSIHQDCGTHEEVDATSWFDQVQGMSLSQPPPRQAPTDQVHKTCPLPGAAPINYPAMRMARHTVGAWVPFTEDSGSSNDHYAFNPAGHGGINEPNTIYSTANQIPREGIAFPAPPLVRPPFAQFTHNYGGAESNENGTNFEFVQWLEPTNGPTYLSSGYEPFYPGAIGEIQSPPRTAPSLSPTPSSDAWNHNKPPPLHNETQPKLRRVVPYPALSRGREESHRKQMKKIPIVSIFEAESVVGPEIREYYGSKGKQIPDNLLWETRKAIGGESIKKISKCIFCGSEGAGSSALYHAKKHLDVNPHACPEKNCTGAFAQSSDLKTHIQKIHNKGSLQLSTVPTPFNN